MADPYRWLEDAGAADTVAWSAAQDDLARSLLDPLPARPWFGDQLRRLLPGSISAPVEAGGRLFFTRRHPEQEHPVLVVLEEHELGLGRGGPARAGRALLDPAALSPDATTTLDGWVPSKEGRLVACFLSEGGAEEASLSVLDVGTGAVVDGPIVLGRSFALAWLPGGQEYFYVRRLPEDRLPAGEGQFHRRVWRRRLGTDVGEDLLAFGEGRDKTAYYGLGTSDDGRWLTISVSLGTAPRNDLFLADLFLADPGEAAGGPSPGINVTAVQEDVDSLTEAEVGPDGRLYLHTNHQAPRWRLAVADPGRPGPEHWTDLLPETELVLDGYTLTQDAVAAVRTRDVVSEVTIHDLGTGAPLAQVPLPGLGSAWATSRPEGGDDVWIGYTDHLTPTRVLHWSVASAALSTWAEPPGDAALVPGRPGRARQAFCNSEDGTRVPVFVLAPPGAKPGDRLPTVLTGYGGFDVSLAPAYSASATAWVAAGGVWAVANLRGGGEYGEAWHRDGMREHKQHVFDDFLAAARWLVAEGWTDVPRLGIIGGSNGGLLVGAALTQAPGQFGAVVCSAPLLDMVRYERFGLGVTWNDEYGRADDPVELGWLLGYSPYHHVVPGTAYPATLFTVFDADTRVDPLHARKMAAALQWASAASPEDAPTLLRRESHVGHSTRSISRTVALAADTSAFLADRLSLVPLLPGEPGLH